MTGKIQEQPNIRLYLALAFLGAILSISLVCRFDVGTPAHSQTALFTDNFEDGNANGWSRSGGSWSIVTDGSRVFNQSGTGSDARVRAGATSWTNYAVQARVKPLAFGGTGRYVALIARAQNVNHFYYLALQNGNQLVLAKRDGGTSTTLASRSFTVNTGTFYTLRIEAQGSALRAFVNGALQLSANDSQYSSGNVGVATFFASGRFDDVVVTTLGGVTPTPIPTPTPGPRPTPTPTPTPRPGPTPTPTPSTGTPDFRLFGFATQNGGTTGGRGGATVTVTTLAALQSAATSASPMIVRISGRITGNTEVRVTSNKTIVGVGSTGELVGIELNLVGSRNIIIRNLKSSRVPASNNDGDIIHMDDTQNVWIDHCEFFNEDPRVQTNVDFYDGLIDITHECSFITISWNYFHDSWKTTLVGSSDSDNFDRRTTFHHNFYETVNSRLPSYRGGVGHVYNNYYFDVITSGINSRVGACLRIEGNVFERVDDPITTLDSDVIGRWDVRDNRFINSTGSQPTTSNCSFTPPYSYPLDNSANVKAIVQQWSGVGIIDPLQGLP